MNSIAKHILSIAFILGFSALSFAQPGWNWGDSVDKAKENNALYSDFVKAENWNAAIKPHSWLLKNTPDLNASIYINGAKIYEGLAESTEDKQKTLQYQAKALEMYDLRIKYFNNEKEVLNRKAYTAYGYYKDDKPKYKELYDLFNKAFQLNGNDIYANNLTAFMDVIRRYKLTGGPLTDEEVFEKYTQISDIIEYQKANGGKEDRLDKIAEYVDKILTATVQVDCEFIINKLGPKYKSTQDINLAKKIFGLMVQQKCLDDPLAMDVAIAVNEVQPDYAISKFIAQRAAADGDIAKANSYYEKAVTLTSDNSKKSEVYLSIARTQSSQGNKVASRASARKALAFDPANKEAYVLIGDLYMNSHEDCKGGESRVKDRGVFLAAYEMYQKGGDSERMASAKAQFPSISEIFNENMEEGQSITVGCWINESVKLERRPAN
ncbi:MAG: hypothetical protein RIC35_03020 [Marinoscillum sp.]